jgi:HD-GYP domain-containing protein (c-di-GMP phosphodiesterase class II)
MTSDRPYRAGMTEEKAASILVEESGKQFHPAVVETFLSTIQTQKEQKTQA